MMKIDLIRFGGLWDESSQAHSAGGVYNKNGLCPTLVTLVGGSTQLPHIIVDKPNSLWYNKEKLKVGKCDG